MLRIRITPEKKPDEEGDIKEVQSVDDTEFVAPKKEDLTVVKTEEVEKASAVKKDFKVEVKWTNGKKNLIEINSLNQTVTIKQK